MAFHRLTYKVSCEAVGLLTENVLLKKVHDRQDRCFIRDPVADQVGADKAVHRWHLGLRLIHAWIAKRVPLLHQMDPQNLFQRIRQVATCLLLLG